MDALASMDKLSAFSQFVLALGAMASLVCALTGLILAIIKYRRSEPNGTPYQVQQLTGVMSSLVDILRQSECIGEDSRLMRQLDERHEELWEISRDVGHRKK